MNEKSQVTQDRLYSEEKKRGRTSESHTWWSGQQESTEKLGEKMKAANSSKPHPQVPRRRMGS
jgi:hypothetical protein